MTNPAEPKGEPPVDEKPREMFLGLEIWQWDGLSGFITVIGFLSVIIGAVWAMFEYTQRVEASKARETMALIEIWEIRGAKDAYISLSREVASELPSLMAQAKQSSLPKDQARKIVYSKVSIRVLQKAENVAHVEMVIYFFNRVSLCIQANLCSAKIARVFFADTLDDFMDYFADDIRKQRKSHPGYGIELEKLSELFIE